MTAPAPVPVLPDTPRVTSYAPVAATGPFSVSFAIYGDSSDYPNWVSVALDGVEQVGNWVLDSPSGSLILLARPITDARITFTAPVTGTLVITGAQRPRRLAQNDENQGVTARDFNQVYTAVIAMLREAWDSRGRQLLAAPGETIGVLPPKASLALQMLGFDASGNPMAAQPSSALVSSAMQDVVAAASHAAALALLGGAPASAIIPIGAEIDWPGLVVPSLWLPEDGTTRLRAGFPELFAVLAPTIPAVVASGSAVVTGIASTSMYAAGWKIEGVNIASGTTILNILDGTRITMSAPATGNGTAIQVFPYGNGDGVSSFTLPNSIGRVYAGLDLAQAILPGGHQLNSLVGFEGIALTIPQLPIVIPAGGVSRPTIAGQGGGVVIGTGAPFATPGAGSNLGLGTLSLNADPVFTGTPFGSGAAHNNVQPTAIRRKIIYAGH